MIRKGGVAVNTKIIIVLLGLPIKLGAGQIQSPDGTIIRRLLQAYTQQKWGLGSSTSHFVQDLNQQDDIFALYGHPVTLEDPEPNRNPAGGPVGQEEMFDKGLLAGSTQ
jgi:hypothetical protein